MKIVVLGGAGIVGAEAARELAAPGPVRKVIIADSNTRRAEKLCEAIGKKAEYEQFDALDHEEAIRVMKKGDVALSCLGPFALYEEKMVRAAMAAGVNYVSICDDSNATEAVLSMNKEIRRTGIFALLGMGWTPGLSNVLARKGMLELDKTKRINISWAAGLGDLDGSGEFFKHLLNVFNGQASTRDGGRWKKVAAGSGEETVEFPEPIGKIPVYHVGHPEPITIPHFYPALEQVTLKGGVAPSGFGTLARTLARLRLTDTPGKRDTSATFVKLLSPFFGSHVAAVSALRVDVHGEKKGEESTASYLVADKMKRLTAAPAATGAILAGSGAIDKKGVLTPETAFDPEDFLTELSKRKVKVISITES